MKNFSEFVDWIRDHIIPDWLPAGECEAYIYPIRKNNGCVKTGLYIRKKEHSRVHLIYLEEYYRRYREGCPEEVILREIREEYEQSETSLTGKDLDLEDFDRVRDRLVYRLVNYEYNKELFETCPYVQIGDLALTFRWIASLDESGIASALVSHDLADKWEVDIPDLLEYAARNTQDLFPAEFRSLREMTEMAMGSLKMADEPVSFFEETSIPAYVLTNRSRLYGASAILYPSCLKDFARDRQSDFFVIPSSVHEVILLPADGGISPDRITTTIRQVNREIVSMEDYLSDSLYIFERATGMIRIASS